MLSDTSENSKPPPEQVMPTLTAEEKAVILSKAAEGTRRVHCIEITSCDILPFLDDGHKLGATAIDAVAAVYQQAAEEEADTYWLVLSAWFGPIVEGTVIEGRHTKTTVEYLQQAANGQNLEVLLAKTLWIIPLCSSKEPKHWVVTWVDWKELKIGIFDSIPELGSSSWAEPLLLRIIDHICVALKREPIDWDSGSWRRVLESPSNLQQQMDLWSCGLFVLMRIRGFKDGRGLEAVSFSNMNPGDKAAHG
ncbi:hypothetical protein NLJ89_g7932 [Agrocybe chaxingu]|uniref:Ubiquitin-like protease family profile domain-containing protein n=1 Tax=Agrocybe chaxingu TaxID=84603 RepID=A0A9W8JVV2_9AGAR|nr:hypothetical protein NLJ89_g7932 [Agrocybe chaxingu]